MPIVRILTVDDHPLMRAGVEAVLGAHPDLVVVAEAGTADEAVAAFREHRPDVTLMDLGLPDRSGVEATRDILALDPDARVLALTTYDGDEDIYRALEAGAAGYLLKDMLRTEIADAVRAVAAGRRVVPPGVAARLAEQFPRAGLTDREREVLAAAADGLSNQQIADRLGIALGTVKVHVRHVLDKLDAPDRTAAVTAALRRGLLHLGRRRPGEPPIGRKR